MDYKVMNRLIEKYFEGTTSLEEERQLRAYFDGPDVDERLLQYQPVFQYFAEQQRIALDKDFEDKLLAQLSEAPSQKFRLRSLNTWVVRIAAAIVLALGVWWLVPENTQTTTQASSIDWSQHEPETPEEAMKILRTALLKTSKELNQGASVAAGEVTKISEVGKFFK